MPFQEITTTIPATSPVRILFHGLIVLHSPEGKTWYAETHRDNDKTHTLSVEVRMKTPDQPDLILLRHHGDLKPPHPGLEITVRKDKDGKPDPNGAVVAPVAKKYVPSSSFPPSSPSPEEKKDFRWVIDLESGDFHDKELKVKPTKTRPGVEISGGLSYLYTALLKLDDIKVRQGGVEKRTLKGLATIVGANLHYDAGYTAFVTCRDVDQQGKPVDKVLPLRKPSDGSGISYEIYIVNNPLFEPVAAAHSELEQYYRVVEEEDGDDIPLDQQFSLEIPPDPNSLAVTAKYALEAGARRASIRIPCMPTTLDR